MDNLSDGARAILFIALLMSLAALAATGWVPALAAFGKIIIPPIEVCR